MAAGYALAWAFVFIPFMISFFFINSNATKTLNACLEILHACLGPLQGLFNFLVYMSPKVRNAKRPIRGRENLSWRQAFIKAFMSRGERRKTGRNLSSRNTRTGSMVSLPQSVQRFVKSLLLRTSTRDTRRSGESNNARTTTNYQSSTNPKQDSDPSEKMAPFSNPRLNDDVVADDMKEDVEDNRKRPQHQELVTDEEEK
jgi:hypothetical protein